MKVNCITPIKFNNYSAQYKNIQKESVSQEFYSNKMPNAELLQSYNNISFGKTLRKNLMSDIQREEYLRKMKIDFKRNEKGEYILSSFRTPTKEDKIKSADLSGIFDKVIEIEGNANFNFSEDFSLGKLKKIGGNASFKHSGISDLKNLEIIKGNADFSHSQVQNTGALKNILGDANFQHSILKSLNNIERIRGNANFQNSKITDFGNLKKIGGNAYFKGCKAKSLDNIELIYGNAYFGYSNIKDLGKLRFVKYHADFNNSKVPYYQKAPFIKTSELRRKDLI